MVESWEWSSFHSRQLGSVIKLTTDSEDEDKAAPVMDQSSQPMGAPFTIHYKVDVVCIGHFLRT